MKIVAALSWYAESPAWLAGAVASAGRLCSHLVAVDGAYALFPQGRPRSSSAEHDAIREACSGAGMGLTLHVPSDVWWGNEVEKRSFLFSLCMQVCEPDVDWIFVFDGDDIVRKVPGDVCAQLAQTDRAVAEVQMVTMYDPQASGVVTQKASQPRRMLWKALPGLRVERNHWTYVAGDGDGYRCLFGPPWAEPEDALRFRGFVVEHRNHQRNRERAKLARGYYTLRDQMAIEKTHDVYVQSVDGRPVLLP